MAGVLGCVRSGHRVVSVEYDGGDSEQAMTAWEEWAGNGLAFGSGAGEWQLSAVTPPTCPRACCLAGAAAGRALPACPHPRSALPGRSTPCALGSGGLTELLLVIEDYGRGSASGAQGRRMRSSGGRIRSPLHWICACGGRGPYTFVMAVLRSMTRAAVWRQTVACSRLRRLDLLGGG
ncbi:unnamed protein product [Miscanthus lutarioriparius]|uniref:Uncharacterized protein n=1 Tax=Miscanthus lutarioriparius TaxID=422564 RepID=A0A811S9G3_9POAL|nr:unnamed protein product [Miscanthus lutarioriparius]